MEKENYCRLYESPAMRQVTGETIRPGGFYLTDRALEFCNLPAGAQVLDVGCGSGATVEYVGRIYRLQAVGIDPSEMLLAAGRQRNPHLNLVPGRGEKLPFAAESMDAVLAECTMSLMDRVDQVLREMHRVLKPAGWLVINDVYARNRQGTEALRRLKMASCLRGALIREELESELEAHGFQLIFWEDHTQLLKELTAKLIFTHGSLAQFWLKTASCTVDPKEAQLAIAQAKLGYFLLIARKKGNLGAKSEMKRQEGKECR